MAEIYGVEKLKKVLGFAFGLTKQVVTSLDDGWQWTDLLGFVDEAAEIPAVGKALSEAGKELSDLSVQEREQLNVFIQTQFDIPNDELEAAIESSLATAIGLIALVQMWKRVL